MGNPEDRFSHDEARPPDKSVYCKTIFSSKTYVLGTQKNRLINETVLLSTQNTCLN